MGIYNSTMNREEKPRKFFRGKGCLEVVSDNELMKLVLTKTVAYIGIIEGTMYSCSYYIKEGQGWVKASTQLPFSNEDDFIKSLRNTGGFATAIREYESEKSNH